MAGIDWSRAAPMAGTRPYGYVEGGQEQYVHPQVEFIDHRKTKRKDPSSTH